MKNTRFTAEQLLEASEDATSLSTVSERLGFGKRYFKTYALNKVKMTFGIDLIAIVRKNAAEAENKVKTCPVCGKQFTGKYSKWANGKFCSASCARSFSTIGIKGATKPMKCYVCGKDVVASIHAEKMLCQSCKKESLRAADIRYREKKAAKLGCKTMSERHVSAGADDKVGKRGRHMISDKDLLEAIRIDKERNPYGMSTTVKARGLAIELKEADKLPNWIVVDKYGFVHVDETLLKAERLECNRNAPVFDILKFAKSSGYIYCVVPNHPRAIDHGYVFLHNVVVENLIGRVIDTTVEIVHHKDRDRFNNKPDNLMLMTKSEHSRLHAEEKMLNDTVFSVVKCPWCEKMFAVRKTEIQKGRKFLSCSPECRGKISSAMQYGHVTEELETRIRDNFVKDAKLKDVLAEYPGIFVK